MAEVPYVLHVWPGKWNLPSHDPECVAAVMYLQLTLPGKFQVAECTNPDLSSNGRLPFLTHGHLVFFSLPAIISFVTSLSKSRTSGASDIDASLNASQKSQRTAWYSHIEANIGDLVSHVFYGIDANFWGLTNPVLASEMSIPQRYYVPGRIRDTYRPRLEASGLWSLPAAQQEVSSPFTKEEKKKEDHKSIFSRVFEREKIMEKARTTFALHARLLDGKQFFFGDHITSIDVYLASHVLLLADPPFPDTVLQVLLLDTYPSLVDHARRVQSQLAKAPAYGHAVVPKPSLLSLIPRSHSSGNPTTTNDKSDAEDVRFRRMRWVWFAFAATAAVYYIVQFSKLIVIVREPEDDEMGDVDAEVELDERLPEDDGDEDILAEGDEED